MQYSNTPPIKKTLGIVISDGVGFRNFILSNFMHDASNTFNNIIIYSCLPAAVYEPYKLSCKIVEIEPFKEHFITWFFRKVKELAHLRKFSSHNFGIKDNLDLNYNISKTARGFATRFIFRFIAYCCTEKWILRFTKWQEITYQFYPLCKEYKNLLDEDKVDLLFFTHQRPPFIAPLIPLAKKLNIKTATFIFSWDNLASKGRMAGIFDYYLVWSNLMKEELITFYTSIKDNQIAVVGTPQFEPYVLPRYETSKEAFNKIFKINPNLPTICFSCGDISTSKNDELYIETIAELSIAKMFVKPVNLIVRTSPAEDPSRFFALQNRFPNIIWNFPKWLLSRENHQEPWSQRIPMAEDIKNLRALLQYCDVNINMCSTMSLDFMQFDKPVINTVFGNAENGLFNDQKFLSYAHYERVVNSEAVAVARNKDELLKSINEALTQPDAKKMQRSNLIKIQTGNNLEETSKRISKALLTITDKTTDV
jgi:hypothetical protein